MDDIALCDNNLNINKKNNINNNLYSFFTSSTIGLDYKYISGLSSKSPQNFLKNNNNKFNNTGKVKMYDNESEIMEKNDIIVDKFDDRSLNGLNSINCIGDADIFSGGCFTTKKKKIMIKIMIQLKNHLFVL